MNAFVKILLIILVIYGILFFIMPGKLGEWTGTAVRSVFNRFTGGG